MMDQGDVTLLACCVFMAKGLNHHPYYGLWVTVHAPTACPGWPAPGPAVATAERSQVSAARMMPLVPQGGLSCSYCKIILNYQFFLKLWL
jgi:hypothetical protein